MILYKVSWENDHCYIAASSFAEVAVETLKWRTVTVLKIERIGAVQVLEVK